MKEKVQSSPKESPKGQPANWQGSSHRDSFGSSGLWTVYRVPRSEFVDLQIGRSKLPAMPSAGERQTGGGEPGQAGVYRVEERSEK